MRKLFFLGDSLKRLREFPDAPRQNLGYQLNRVQQGLRPIDRKSMPSIGSGVEEARERDATGAYRVIYIARYPEGVYVLHAFQKKTQQTPQVDIELAKKRLAEIMRTKK